MGVVVGDHEVLTDRKEIPRLPRHHKEATTSDQLSQIQFNIISYMRTQCKRYKGRQWGHLIARSLVPKTALDVVVVAVVNNVV